MNAKTKDRPQRVYRQSARAQSTEATSTGILDAFLKRLEKQWFEDIKLDELAEDADVTVQTVLRKFGSKTGIMEAAHRRMGGMIEIRRATHPGDIGRTVDVLTNDYEEAGRLVLRLLSQEERHPALQRVVEQGRVGHRDWLAQVFASALSERTPARRVALLDALVVVTDIYVWKLVRVDMGRPVPAYKTMVKQMLTAALAAQ